MEELQKDDVGPSSSDTLVMAALKVLNAEDPWTKAAYGDAAASLWLKGEMRVAYDDSIDALPVPDRPARLPTVRLVSPSNMPKLGKGGSLHSRQALLHSLVHTESWAIDLSWDIIARFGKAEAMPRDFFDDFVKVAQDEGRHFRLLAARLEELGSYYGALPAHDGLWDSAEATAHDLSARLAVEHCVHEARGLDVLPTTISRFRKGGDYPTASLLESVIFPEEITHCAAGVKWFTFFCQRAARTVVPAPNAFHCNGVLGITKECPPKEERSETQLEAHQGEGCSNRCERNCADIVHKEPTVNATLSDSNSQMFEVLSDGNTQILELAHSMCSLAGVEAEEGAAVGERVGIKEVLSRSGASSFQGGKLPREALGGSSGSPEHVVAAFHAVVRKYFRGPLKAPFNESARAAAGFGPEWYLPLATNEHLRREKK